ncbi:PP2C family protein-serine/threonine phosphatase [Streptomyces ochraceiscleroticus]|uniref:PP2C family protein-serine/threonine phosphatase n=1 Tax=Streptomyces ochraceiscleroticus TaxID=47761 RepID=A0ABW1MEN3_9ACTN|nr:PP2C family protein-serine/threonine phosphatase [Streptomyces ochraceiscleroticus]
MEFIGALLGYGCGFLTGLACGVLAERRSRTPSAVPDAHDACAAALGAVAHAAQRALLQPLSGELNGVGLAGRYRPATENAVLGGDLLNVADSPYGPRVLIGDVRGHDLEAARLATLTIGCFREHAFTAPDLVQLTRSLDERLAPELDSEGFVTAVLAEFAPGEVRLVNCGHPAPLRIGARLDLLAPDEPGPPLGLQPVPCPQRFRLSANERLLLYTDGLIEALDPDGDPFPLDERVREALTRPTLDDAVEALQDLLTAHTAAPLRDDLALMLCQPGVRAPVPSVPAARGPGERTGGPS